MATSSASTLAMHFGRPLIHGFTEKGLFGKPFVRAGPMFTQVCPWLFQMGGCLGYGLRGYPEQLGCLFVRPRENAARYVLESWPKAASEFLARVKGTPANLHELYVVRTLAGIGIDLNDPQFVSGSRSRWAKQKINLEGVREMALLELLCGAQVGYHHPQLLRSCWEDSHRERPESEWDEAYRYDIVSSPSQPMRLRFSEQVGLVVEQAGDWARSAGWPELTQQELEQMKALAKQATEGIADQDDEGSIQQTVQSGDTSEQSVAEALAGLEDMPKITDVFNDVIQKAAESIAREPENPASYLGRGIILAGIGETGRAIADFDQAITLDPANADAYLGRGRAYAKLNQPRRAVEDLSEAARIDPRAAETYVARGAVYASLGQLQRAVQDYSEAISLDSELFSAYVNRGLAYYNGGGVAHLEDPDLAIMDFEEAIRLDPREAAAYYARGNVYLHLENPQRAINDYDVAIDLDAEDAATYYNRGLAYLDLGQPQRALGDFDAAVELDPLDSDLYYGRGKAHLGLEDPERAIEDFSVAIELDAEHAATYYNRALAYLDVGQPQRALEDFDAAVELDPLDSHLYYGRGTAHLDLEDPERAVEDFSEAIELSPRDAELLSSRAGAYLDQALRVVEGSTGDTRQLLTQLLQARQDLDEAITLDPNLTTAYDIRAIVNSVLEKLRSEGSGSGLGPDHPTR